MLAWHPCFPHRITETMFPLPSDTLCPGQGVGVGCRLGQSDALSLKPES